MLLLKNQIFLTVRSPAICGPNNTWTASPQNGTAGSRTREVGSDIAIIDLLEHTHFPSTDHLSDVRYQVWSNHNLIILLVGNSEGGDVVENEVKKGDRNKFRRSLDFTLQPFPIIESESASRMPICPKGRCKQCPGREYQVKHKKQMLHKYGKIPDEVIERVRASNRDQGTRPEH